MSTMIESEDSSYLLAEKAFHSLRGTNWTLQIDSGGPMNPFYLAFGHTHVTFTTANSPPTTGTYSQGLNGHFHIACWNGCSFVGRHSGGNGSGTFHQPNGFPSYPFTMTKD